ncbi:MAG: toll/interleukin-1 receptor domain-containing protein [Blastocatellales bacterium]
MKVFISYANANRELAKKVSESLKQSGFIVWDSEEEVLPGDNWAEKIAQGLEEADAMVVILTQESLLSRAVRKEIEYALGKKTFKHRLIPVYIDSQDNLSEENIPWILRRLKIIKLSGNLQAEKELDQIAQALRAVA